MTNRELAATPFTEAEIRELIALHGDKIAVLTKAGRDASYHEQRVRNLTERLNCYHGKGD